MSNYLFPPPNPELISLERKRRVMYAAVSGFIAGTICTLLLTFVNVWMFPNLPIYIEPFRVLVFILFWIVGGSLFAGISAYSQEGWGSIIPAAAVMAAVILIWNFLQGTSNLFLNAVVLTGLLIPFSGMLMPIGYLFYWLAERFIHAQELSGWARWRILILNGLIITIVGILPGWYEKFNERTEKSVSIMHALLQENAKVNALDALSDKLPDTQSFRAHRAMPYQLSQAKSRVSTVGVDVTAHYEDGYMLRCLVILYPDRDPSISGCKEVQK